LIKENPSKLLDLIINRTLLLQQAKKEGVAAPPKAAAASPGEQLDQETATIMAYLDKKVAALPPVTSEEVEQIYEAYKDQMAGRKKEEVLPLIRQMIEAQRKEVEAGKVLIELRRDARIEIDEKTLRKLAATPAGMETQSEEDFRKGLTGGKPMVVDFGSNSCIPCRQLRPVLQKVRKDYAGKLEVLIIDIRNHQTLAEEYRIQVIPTILFFDPMGKEMHRHQGFMSEEKIKEQLGKMGVV
jgi:thioredoxin 1